MLTDISSLISVLLSVDAVNQNDFWVDHRESLALTYIVDAGLTVDFQLHEENLLLPYGGNLSEQLGVSPQFPILGLFRFFLPEALSRKVDGFLPLRNFSEKDSGSPFLFLNYIR